MKIRVDDTTYTLVKAKHFNVCEECAGWGASTSSGQSLCVALGVACSSCPGTHWEKDESDRDIQEGDFVCVDSTIEQFDPDLWYLSDEEFEVLDVIHDSSTLVLLENFVAVPVQFCHLL